MKVVIFAGGLGTRISEESHLKPKPMIEIGNKPILWHIMKIYATYGHNDFIICCGYKASVIKEYFLNYYQLNADLTVDLAHNAIEVHQKHAEPPNLDKRVEQSQSLILSKGNDRPLKPMKQSNQVVVLA